MSSTNKELEVWKRIGFNKKKKRSIARRVKEYTNYKSVTEYLKQNRLDIFDLYVLCHKHPLPDGKLASMEVEGIDWLCGERERDGKEYVG